MDRGQHDLGGLPAGPMELSEHEAAPFGKLFTAIFTAMRQHNLATVDELRRSLEALPEDVYNQDYYERWGEAMCNLLDEKGIVSHAEIEQRIEEIKTRLEAEK